MNIRAISKSFIFLCFITCACNAAYAQAFDELLFEQDEKYPQDKIHIHYDRPYYLPGETIWFKAYITTRSLPATLSKNLYAELLDEQGNILQKKLMPIIEAGAAAEFEIPDTIRSTKLFVKAYTAWMLNFDSSLLYLKPINILQTKDANSVAQKAVITLTLFPEGGNLVEGLMSKLSFKAHDQNGIPFAIKGEVKNNKGALVTSFQAKHDGMGYFSIVPQPGETYTAFWKDGTGAPHQTNLPVAVDMGATLAVEQKGGRFYYTVSRSENANDDFKTFYVVAHMDQQFLYLANINLSNKTTVSPAFPTDSLPDGIVQLTLFNAKKIPIAERIFFVNNQHYYFITDLHAVEKNLDKRGKNVIQIDVGGSLLSNLSISVTDESLSKPTAHRENIFSELLLSTNLKGYVHNPAYYFSEHSEEVIGNTDLLMLTNGWRRFHWEDVLHEKRPELTYEHEDYLSISGRVLSSAGFLMKGKALTGIIGNKAGGNGNFFEIPFEDDGKFKVGGIFFYDTVKLYYQINNDKDKRLTNRSSFAFNKTHLNVEVPVTDLMAKIYTPIKPEKIVMDQLLAHHSLWLQQEKEQSKVKTLETVIVESKGKTAKQKAEEEFTSGFFNGGDSYSFVTEDDLSANAGQSVLSYLQGKVAGINISLSGEGSVSWRGSETSLFLNEMPTDIQQIQGLTMSDVAYIKVFRPPFFGASFGGSGGAVAVYLKKGRTNNSTAQGMEFVMLHGYSVMKEFYAPDYETNIGVHPGTDLRTTLYWNPFVIMDKKTRRLQIPFFNNDNATKFRVVIEGLNALGQMCREEKIIQ